MNVTLTPMSVGSPPKRVTIAAYAQDNQHDPSQIPDTSTTFNISGAGSICTIAPVAGDNRSFDITAVNPGTVTLVVDEPSPPFLAPTKRLNMNLTVQSPPPDTRRVDFVSES